ncbi:hypothetical protein NS115_03765 [Paenibacillus jamilae]|uniref:Uncharacterized protein n=1 Tax=Paenibacillus jamilae TaxID=114136 RepID=A0ACC4ZZF2_9BACL|nr:hypothetical protein [Paenibacillus jamilae]KTS84456.1 hypothetical protein NS115_03765 [Paenibacillus jamilae]
MSNVTTIYAGRFTGDYKTAFAAAVYELLAVQDMPVNFRISAVEVLTEAYYEQTGERPSTEMLSLLADFILRDDLSDRDPDKVTKKEYPFLSKDQIKTRGGREFASDNMARYTSDIKHKLNGKRASISRECVGRA